MLEKYTKDLNDVDLMNLSVLINKSTVVGRLLEKFELEYGFKFFTVDENNLNLVVCSKIIDKRKNSYEDENGIVFRSSTVTKLEALGWVFKNKVEFVYYDLFKKIHNAALEKDSEYLLANSKRKLNAMIDKHLKHF